MILIKVVPGTRNNEIIGLIGERLKVRVSAPPEDGKANMAVCLLIAKTLGIKKNTVSIVSGKSSPLKTVAILGINKLALGDLIDSQSI